MPVRPYARWLSAAALAIAVVLPASAGAASFDSQAPEDAPPHWLPPEAWVYNHWVPYDEGRLYRLLRIRRADLWVQLRDDRRTVAQLARRRGWPDVDRLAAALVAPWRGRASRARMAVLRGRARRTLTQGHMAQHLFFHSLHQFAIASEAPSIFGVSDARFRELRRVRELSPLTIARLAGRSPARVEAQATAVLRERIRAGVAGRAMTERQGAILLRRQLTQLPRWLAQARYNGPPVTRRGKLVAAPHDYASNPSVAADGSRVVFEAYRQRLPQALRLGEIAVLSRPAGGAAAARLVSRSPAPDARGVRPASAYNATTSGDGRLVAFESAAGNANFAKRYGRIGVLLCDLRTGRTVRVDRPPRGTSASKSAYNPVLSADGRRLAFQAVRGAGRAELFVRDLRRGTTLAAGRGLPRAPAGATTSIYEPALSGDGRVVAFTVATVPARGGLRAASSRVFVRDLGAGVTRAVGSPGGGGFASNPALSGDGRIVAFTAAAAGDDRPRLVVHDLATGRTRPVAGADEAAAIDPQLSHDGAVVAWTAIHEGVGRVLVHDARTGVTELVSRASGADGGEADAAAGDPSLSADGRMVAFASEATNLAPGKPDATRGVFLRDRAAATTTLVSAPSRSGPRRPTAPAVVPAAAPAPRTVAGAPLIYVRDNDYALQAVAPRPDLIVRAGTVVRWRWASKQSHDVTVRSGPEAFASPTKSGGGFSRRLRRRGTYRLACSLHAPGMRMTVRVR